MFSPELLSTDVGRGRPANNRWTLPMLKPEPEDVRIVLIPFDPQVAISVAEAAERSAKSESTVRSWCVTHRIGRRIADGH
jgi:hypothetical protein